MVAFNLEPGHQKRLEELARSQGQDSAAFARKVLTDFLDFQALSTDSEEAWAEASVTMTPEFMEEEDWGET